MHAAITAIALLILTGAPALAIYACRQLVRHHADARRSWTEARQLWAQLGEPAEQQEHAGGEQR